MTQDALTWSLVARWSGVRSMYRDQTPRGTWRANSETGVGGLFESANKIKLTKKLNSLNIATH